MCFRHTNKDWIDRTKCVGAFLAFMLMPHLLSRCGNKKLRLGSAWPWPRDGAVFVVSGFLGSRRHLGLALTGSRGLGIRLRGRVCYEPVNY